MDKVTFGILHIHVQSTCMYHIAGKFGRELNLVVWRSNLHFVTAKLKYFILAYTKSKYRISSKSSRSEILFKTPFGAATI